MSYTRTYSLESRDSVIQAIGRGFCVLGALTFAAGCLYAMTHPVMGDMRLGLGLAIIGPTLIGAGAWLAHSDGKPMWRQVEELLLTIGILSILTFCLTAGSVPGWYSGVIATTGAISVVLAGTMVQRMKRRARMSLLIGRPLPKRRFFRRRSPFVL